MIHSFLSPTTLWHNSRRNDVGPLSTHRRVVRSVWFCWQPLESVCLSWCPATPKAKSMKTRQHANYVSMKYMLLPGFVWRRQLQLAIESIELPISHRYWPWSVKSFATVISKIWAENYFSSESSENTTKKLLSLIAEEISADSFDKQNILPIESPIQLILPSPFRNVPPSITWIFNSFRKKAGTGSKEHPTKLIPRFLSSVVA